jgi:AraC-like DNA-binding protein
MPRIAASADAKSLSDLLSGLELHGQTWCYSDLCAPAGFSIPPSEAVLFHAVLHGSVRVACASGEVTELGEGDVAVVLSGEAHALRTSADSSASAHDFLRENHSVDIPPTVQLGAGSRVQTRLLSGRLQAVWPGQVNRAALPSLLRINGNGAASAALLRADALAMAGMGAGSSALLTRLASLLVVAGLRAEPRCRQLFAPPRRDPIAQALQLIDADPSANWTVERLARAVGMGRSNFAAHFTQEVGRAPMEVVAEQRMEHAATLLRQGKLKIAEISELAGYSSEAAFSRRFTRHFGISPSQMRERERASEAEANARTQPVQRLLTTRMTEGVAAVGRRPAAIGLPVTGSTDGKRARFRPNSMLVLGSRQ